MAPGASTMKVNSALGMILAASAVFLDGGRPALRRLVALFGTLLVLISLATLTEYAFGWNLGIDQLFITDRAPAPPGAPPGRMAVITAVCFLFLGSALLAGNHRRGLLWTQYFSLGTAFVCLANLVGYVYGVDNFYGMAFYTAMAADTSFGLFLLALSILFSRPERGPMAVASSRNLGGVLVRRLLPAAVIVPVFLGWLRWQGELKGWYGPSFGVAAYTAANVGIFAVLIWIGGLRLNRMDSERAQVEGSFRLALEAAPNAMVIVDGAGRIVMANAQTEKYFGYRRDQLLGQPVEILLPEQAREHHVDFRRGFAAAPEMRTMGAGRDLYGLRQDGSRFPAIVGLNPLHSPFGEWVLASILDITDRKQAEELRARFAEARSEQRFRLSFDEAPVGMALIGGDGRWLRVNRALCEMTGYTETELIALNHDITHTDDLAETRRLVPQMLSGAVPSMGKEKRYAHKHGETIYVLLNVAVVDRDESGRPLLFVAHIQNLTDQKRAERELEASRAQIVSSARLSALGMMAGGIAHEINNPLAIIDASAANLLHMKETGAIDLPALFRNAGRIKETTARIAKIVGSLRRIAREGSADEFLDVSARQIVEETLELSSERFRANNIRFEAPSIDPNILVRAREAEICQVLLNLLQNAFDAVVECAGERWVKLDVAVRRPSVVFSVTDSGPGIALEIRKHIMEPFFTTKPVGKGTGLGLSISASIASEHGGVLELAEDSVHTCFRLALPLPGGDTVGDETGGVKIYGTERSNDSRGR